MWFYRYVIRGLGVVLVAGMLTLLALAIHRQLASAGRGSHASRQSSFRSRP